MADDKNNGANHLAVAPPILEMPAVDDPPEVLHRKLAALAAVVRGGSSSRSIAAATNYAAVPANPKTWSIYRRSPYAEGDGDEDEENDNIAAVPERDAAKTAVDQMPPDEFKFWTAHAEGRMCRLPDVDWEDPSTRAREPTSAKPLRTATRRAEALSRLYGRTADGGGPGDKTPLSAGHAVWFAAEHLWCLPLVKAVARVIGAERNLSGGRADGAGGAVVGGAAGSRRVARSAAEVLADVQTVNKILSVAGRAAAHWKRSGGGAGRDLSRVIAPAHQALVAHRVMLRAALGSRGVGVGVSSVLATAREGADAKRERDDNDNDDDDNGRVKRVFQSATEPAEEPDQKRARTA